MGPKAPGTTRAKPGNRRGQGPAFRGDPGSSPAPLRSVRPPLWRGVEKCQGNPRAIHIEFTFQEGP